jgi:hypothetical protein
MAVTRYPGVTSFQDTDLSRQLFFGRDEESRRLLYFILSDALTVLYSRSGYGKTSLLQAKVFGLLREQACFPVFMRFNRQHLTPTEVIKAELKESKQQGYEIISNGEQAVLSNFFSEFEIWSCENKLQTPVIVLDQFEEMFTLEHNHPYWETFFYELAKVLGHAKEGRLSIKFIISIREDYLGHLEKMASAIPSIFSNRFRLEALSKTDAQQAIEEPGKIVLDGVEFSSPKIFFEASAMAELQRFLALRLIEGRWSQSNDVEPIQLQIICSELEEKATEAKRRDGISEFTVSSKDLEGEAGLKRMLGDFYSKQMGKLQEERKLSDAEMDVVKNLVEEELIVGNRRVPKSYDAILAEKGIAKETLDLLIKNKLLKLEKYQQSTLVELSHDTLVEPITKAREIRRQQKDLQKKEAALLAGRRKIRRRYLIAFVILVAAFGMLLLYLAQLASRREGIKDKQESYRMAATAARKINPTLAYLIARDGNSLDSTSHVFDTLLSYFTKENYFIQSYYMVATPVLWGAASETKTSILTDMAFYQYDHGGQLNYVFNFHSDAYVHIPQATANNLFFMLNRTGNDLVIKNEGGNVVSTHHFANPISTAGIAISGDGTHFVVRDSLYTTMKNGAVVSLKDKGIYGDIEAVKFSSDSKRVVFFHSNSDIVVKDLTGKTVNVFYPGTLSVSTIEISPDGRYLLANIEGTDPILWDIDALPENDNKKLLNEDSALAKLTGHTGTVTCFSFSPDNQYIITGGDDQLVIIWNLRGKMINVLSGHSGYVSFVSFSGNSEKVVSGAENGEVIVWNYGRADNLFQLGKLASFSPYDYYSFGFDTSVKSVYNVKNVYKNQTTIEGLYASVLNYSSRLPMINLFPGDEIYERTWKFCIVELDRLYQRLFDHPDFHKALSLPTKNLLYTQYIDLLRTKTVASQKDELVSTEEIELKLLPWKTKALLTDTSDKYGMVETIVSYGVISNYLEESRAAHSMAGRSKAAKDIDIAKNLCDAFLLKTPDDISLLNVAVDVYMFSSLINYAPNDRRQFVTDIETAIKLARRIEDMNPSDLSGKTGLVKAYLQMGDYDSAMKWYTVLKKEDEFGFVAYSLKEYFTDARTNNFSNAAIEKFVKQADFGVLVGK